MPDVNEAFVAEFTFSPSVQPQPIHRKNGPSTKPGWESATRPKRFRWRSRVQKFPHGWEVQETDPLVVVARGKETGTYPAAGNALAIEVVAHPQMGQISEASVEIVAAAPDSKYDFVDPPFASYCWGTAHPGAPPIGFPKSSGEITKLTSSGHFHLSIPAGVDEHGHELAACPLLNLKFADESAFTHPKLFLAIVLSLKIGDKPYFHDPEMEIDLGTGDC